MAKLLIYRAKITSILTTTTSWSNSINSSGGLNYGTFTWGAHDVFEYFDENGSNGSTTSSL